MRKLTNLLLATLVVGFVACNKDDDGGKDNSTSTSTLIEGEISSDRTLDADKTYTLKGNVYVTNGATLKIPAGTVIMGDKLTKGALVVTRGSKINATGTADNPVIFTSSAPSGFRNRGDWGGVVILGKATNNKSTDEDIEGISAGNSNALHGGDNDADNSGVMQYVRIEFAGIALTPDNELNSLTMGSVGNGTTIDHIMVSYAGDDAYEWFGGTVNGSYLVAYNTLDDDFDTDMGYRGSVDYGVVVRDPNVADVSGSNAFEADNNKNTPTLAPISSPTFNHITAVGPYATKKKEINANYQHAGHLRRGSNIVVKNSIMVGYPTGFNFDEPGASANLEGVVIGQNTDASDQEFVIGTAPGSMDVMEVADQATIFTNDSWKNLSNPDVSGVAASYSTYGAFAGSPSWNWSAGWLNFDPINAAY